MANNNQEQYQDYGDFVLEQLQKNKGQVEKQLKEKGVIPDDAQVVNMRHGGLFSSFRSLF